MKWLTRGLQLAFEMLAENEANDSLASLVMRLGKLLKGIREACKWQAEFH